ncbi:MAG: hypothetical protein WD509_03110 [Candidatus Paceibacterota bacterium]
MHEFQISMQKRHNEELAEFICTGILVVGITIIEIYLYLHPTIG